MGKFRMRISKSWFSEDYVYFKYSTNGIIWKTLKEVKIDIMINRFKLGTRYEYYPCSEILFNEFNTVEKIKIHEDELKLFIKNKNKDILEYEKKKKKSINKFCQNFNR